MKCHVAANMQVESGKYPCGICGKGVSRNLIRCGGVRNGSIRNAVECRAGKLKEDPGYRCTKCVKGGCAEGGAEKQEVVLEDASSLECINKFCYLDDMLAFETEG